MKAIKKLFTNTVLGAFVFAALIFAGVAFPAKVQAAAQYENHRFNYYTTETLHAEIADAHFWYYKDLKYAPTPSGKKIVLYTPQYNEHIQPVVVSNGSYACFAVQKKGASTATVYATNLKTKARKVLCTYKTTYGEFMAYYSGKIYLSRLNGDDAGSGNRITRYDTKTHKYKAIKSAVDFNPQQYGAYLVFSNPHGDPGPVKLYTYNMRTGKNKTISYKSNSHSVVNGTLYYMDWSSSNTKGYLKRCKLDGSSTKSIIIVQGVSAANVGVAFAPTYAIFSIYTYKYGYTHHSYVKIDYRTGKQSPSSESAYRKLCGY